MWSWGDFHPLWFSSLRTNAHALYHDKAHLLYFKCHRRHVVMYRRHVVMPSKVNKKKFVVDDWSQMSSYRSDKLVSESHSVHPKYHVLFFLQRSWHSLRIMILVLSSSTLTSTPAWHVTFNTNGSVDRIGNYYNMTHSDENTASQKKVIIPTDEVHINQVAQLYHHYYHRRQHATSLQTTTKTPLPARNVIKDRWVDAQTLVCDQFNRNKNKTTINKSITGDTPPQTYNIWN